jgi:hypothetical protein
MRAYVQSEAYQTNPALADVEHIGGYAQANRLYADGWLGLSFERLVWCFIQVDDDSVTLSG